MQGIGVDADEAYLGPHILTSALKKVDVAVFDAIKTRPGGKFKGGTDVDRQRQEWRRRPRRARPGGPEVRRPDQEVQDEIAAGRSATSPTRSTSQEWRRSPRARARGMTKRFGPVVANDGRLRTRPGEVHALLGENGAGKSTLMSILYGLRQPARRNSASTESRRGQLAVGAIELGIGMVHQHFMLVPVMTVTETSSWERATRAALLLDVREGGLVA